MKKKTDRRVRILRTNSNYLTALAMIVALFLFTSLAGAGWTVHHVHGTVSQGLFVVIVLAITCRVAARQLATRGTVAARQLGTRGVRGDQDQPGRDAPVRHPRASAEDVAAVTKRSERLSDCASRNRANAQDGAPVGGEPPLAERRTIAQSRI